MEDAGVTTRRIAVLMAGNKLYPAYAAFQEQLRLEAERFSITVETVEKFAGGRHESLRPLAAEIVDARPDVVVAIGAVSFFAVRDVTKGSVPVVFAIVIDPIASGIVPPKQGDRGDITGVTSFEPRQTLEQMRLLAEAVGEISTVAVIGDADVPPLLAELAESTARSLGIRPVVRLLRSPDDIHPAIAWFRGEGAAGVLGLEVPRINAYCVDIAEAATAAGLPTVFGWDMARASPLLAYGTSLSEATRRAATLAIRIAAGESPKSLPLEHTRKMKLTVNLATAERLGLELPWSVMDAATQVRV